MNKAGLRNSILRHLSIVFILFSIETNTQASDSIAIHKIDSIQSLIYETNSTEKKFELYEALFKIYSSNNELEKMLEMAEVQYALALDYKDILLKAKALRNIGNTAYSLNRFKLAEVKLEKALAAFNKFKDYHNEKASVLNNLANLKSQMGDYISGLDYYHQAYDVLLSSNENKRKKETGIILLNLGVTYSDVGLIDDALLYYEMALSIFQKENNLELVVFCLNNIGSIYLNQKQYKKALFTFEGNAKKIDELKDKSPYEGLYKLNLGVAYWHNGQKKKGLEYMEFGKAFYEKRNDEVNSLGCDLEIAKVKLLEGSLKEARDLMYKSYNKSIEIGLAEETKNTSEGLQKIYSQLGIWDSAYKYQHIYFNLKDSLSGEEMRSKLIKLSLNDKFKKAEQLRQTKHEGELKEQEFINWFIIVFSFLIMVFSGFIYVIYRDKRKSHIIITKQKEAIVDSLNYAQRIQSAILISEEQLKKLWKELFVFLKPRELVSGDFYWIHKTEEHIMFAVVDCVGHGVPGAFMTMIGNTLLNDIVIERDIKEPGEILKELHRGVVKGLRQEKDSKAVDEGMDISFCSLDIKTRKLSYAGAMSPIYIIHSNDVQVIKADFKSVGGVFKRTILEDRVYETKNIDLSEGDVIYMFTDGIADQFGGANNEKYNTQRFKKLLKEIYKNDVENQKDIIKRSIMDWMKGYPQTDDMLVLGFKV